MTSITIQADTGPLPAGGPSNYVTMDVHLPQRMAAQAALLFCVPGGGVNRHYFDLDGECSLVRAMTAAGHVVVTADPLGVGESTRPADGFALTAEVEADALHRAFLHVRKQMIDGIALGALRPIGVGHSAGALLAVTQQAVHRDFAAMLLFCFGIDGLPEFLSPQHKAALEYPATLRAALPELARIQFGKPYFEIPMRDMHTAIGKILDAVHDKVVAVIGLHAMTPGNVAPEIATISVPVFLGAGGSDMTGPPHLLGTAYAACQDFTLYVSPNTGHHLFVASDGSRLFRRVTKWIAALDV